MMENTVSARQGSSWWQALVAVVVVVSCAVVWARWCQRRPAAGVRVPRIARHRAHCRDERPCLCRQTSTTELAGETLHARRLCTD